MPNFRKVGNGFVSDIPGEAEVAVALKELNLLRKDVYSDYSLTSEGHVAVETLQRAGLLVGPDFRAFLEANYDSGRGPLAQLIKDIVHYLNGKVAYQTLVTLLRMEERKLAGRIRNGAQPYGSTRVNKTNTPLVEDGMSLTGNDLYRLAAGLSPANVGRFLMLVGGENYYV